MNEITTPQDLIQPKEYEIAVNPEWKKAKPYKMLFHPDVFKPLPKKKKQEHNEAKTIQRKAGKKKGKEGKAGQPKLRRSKAGRPTKAPGRSKDHSIKKETRTRKSRKVG